MPASGSNPPQRKGWREASQPGRAAGSSPGPGKARAAGWTKKAGDDRYESALLRYRLRVAFWTVLFFGLVGAFIAYLILRPLRTPLIAYAATGYAAPLPPNAWASEDLAGLKSLGSESGRLVVGYGEIAAWETKDKWLDALREQIKAAQPGGPNKNAIIIYLSVHGAVDKDGEPCLIPPGASPWQSSQWVRVGELLHDLFLYHDEKDSYATKIKGWDKLLVLDCNRIDANWNVGQFYNSFAARLPDVVRSANVPRLHVLNSTSAGQAAWSAPELHGSVFGYYFAQGLGGAADVEPGGNHNKQVSLHELYGYLKANVNQWVIENRDDRQVPMLMPEDAPDAPGVPLVHCDGKETVFPKEPFKRDDRWDQVAALWQRHAQLRAKKPYRTKPMEWAAFQFDLLRAEQLLQAGSAYNSELNATLDRLKFVEAPALDRAVPATDAAPYSVTLAERWRPASEKELRDVPPPWTPGGKPKASEPTESKPAAAEKTDNKAPPAAVAKDAGKDAAGKPPVAAAAAQAAAPAPAEHPRYGYLPAAAVAWKLARDHHDTADDLKQILTVVDGAENQPREDGADGTLKADVVEVQFLRMLAAYLDANVWKRPDLIGSALEARQFAEMAVASPDLVTQYWIQNLVDEADGDRRLAEDNLYVGSKDALNEAENRWEKAGGEGGKYRVALSRADDLKNALAVRDQAWAEAPYLAQCLLARLPAGKPDAADLRALLDGMLKLSALLEDTPETGQWPAELPRATDQVATALKNLRTAYDRESDALGKLEEYSEIQRRTAVVLALPLVTGRERNDFREKSLAIMTARQSTNARTDKQPESKDLGDDWRTRLDDWEKTSKHPALTLLDLGAIVPGVQEPAAIWPKELDPRLAAQGEKARARLDQLIDKAQQGVQETRISLAKRRPTRSTDVHLACEGCRGAERALRASAGLAGGPLALQVDPIAELHGIDLRELLLWETRRTMADFWGPKPGAAQANDAAKPYFEIVSADDLRSADKLADKMRRSADAPEAVRLKQLTAAAESAVRPTVEPKDLRVDNTITEISQTMTANVGASLPSGTAAVYLEYSGGPLPAQLRDNHLPLRRLPVDVQDAQTSVPIRLPAYVIAKDWETGKDWQAKAFYRGHIRAVDLHFVRLPPGESIVYVPQRAQLPAKISVSSASQKQTGIIFILDCSGSMSELVDKSKPASQPKINVARQALIDALELLATNKDACRVGVMAYAHRLRWSQTKPYDQILTHDPNNPGGTIPLKLVPHDPKLDRLTPDNDIEVFDLLGGAVDQLNVRRVAEIEGWLRKLQSLGQTPLYHSIMDAVDQLKFDTKSEQKKIFVLTDGMDYLLHPDPNYTVSTLESKLTANPGIRLDIVGFQVDASEDKNEYNKLMGLVSDTKLAGRVGYRDAKDRDGLMDALRKALNLDMYQVLHATTGDPVSPKLELNKAFELNPLTPGRFRVQLVDSQRAAPADVYLDGGEALEMWLEKGRLVHRRYEREIRDSLDKIDDPTNHEHTLWIGAHEARRLGNDVEFHVSVQNGDAAEFSPRPVEAWVEIKPLAQPGGPGEAESYNFYDLSFVPDTPVPVLRVTVPHWRPQYEKAEINLWCKFRATEEESVTLGKLQGYPVSDVPKVSFECSHEVSPSGDTKIVIKERHEKGEDIHRLKLELLRPGDPRLVKVNRRFVSQPGDVGFVIHEFYLEGNYNTTEIEEFPVRIVSRKRLEQGAVSLPRPLRVPIP